MKKNILLLILLSTFLACSSTKKPIMESIPDHFKNVISSIEIDKLGIAESDYKFERIDENTLRVEFTFNLKDSIQQDDLQIRIRPSFIPDFNWAPHLTPTDNHVIDQHVFRTPVMIVTNAEKGLSIIPDVDLITREGMPRWYMDMDAKANMLTIGVSNTHITDHVLFERRGGAVFPKGKIKIGFYVMNYTSKNDLENPFRKPLAFFWINWGQKEFEKENIVKKNLEPYVKHTYNWAFDSWSKYVWQEFTLNGKRVGAPCFIVNTTQSPNYSGEVNFREFLSIWNQAWFSSLRSASGLYRYATRTNNSELLEKAKLSKELALSAPQKNGFFYGLIATEMEDVTIEGKNYRRSKGWDTHYWGNSNRNPYTWDPRHAPFHILDMSWTALLMLRWYDELEQDKRLLNYANTYAEALLKQQTPNGYYPGWLDLNTLQPMQHLNNSPESSMSVIFLLKLYEITKENKYKTSALKAIDRIIEDIVLTGRWEDFETYWSCCRWGSEDPYWQKSREKQYV